VASGVTPVIIAGAGEGDEAALIQGLCPQARNLCGRTSLHQLATLARHGLGVLGNDTGPFHLIWLAGSKPAIGLFSGRSDPLNCGPLNSNDVCLQAQNIQEIDKEKVWKIMRKLYEFPHDIHSLHAFV
jgi:ADP-heptose:LPS heptosyltransferase